MLTGGSCGPPPPPGHCGAVLRGREAAGQRPAGGAEQGLLLPDERVAAGTTAPLGVLLSVGEAVLCESVLCESVVCESVLWESVLCESVLCESVLCESVLCESVGGESVLCGV